MWSYHIDGERRLVTSTAWDLVTGAEILEHRRQLSADPRFRRSFFQLVDLTRVTGVALDYKAVEELSRDHIFSRKSRRAFVAPNLLAYGMSRMFITLRQLTGGVEQMEIFKNRDHALRWLLPRPTQKNWPLNLELGPSADQEVTLANQWEGCESSSSGRLVFPLGNTGVPCNLLLF